MVYTVVGKGTFISSRDKIQFAKRSTDANLLPIIYAMTYYGEKTWKMHGKYSNQKEDKLHKLLIRNNFGRECFGMSYEPRKNETAVHGACDRVFTCGQYYHNNQKMDFTVVDVGRTIQENVRDYLKELGQKVPDSCIAWTVEPEHSTKKTNSGGIGLSLMHDFIYYNNGKFQIVSGNEFWELNAKNTECEKLDVLFPGTIAILKRRI